jgi:adenosyl cobinamide kinase/adenosyl cobinamide phosphate guanylyltransferase
MARLVLILGGARSGKSRFAQELARRLGGDEVLFVATSEARDAEMQRRIERHQQSRPASWRLLEVPREVGRALDQTEDRSPVVLIDCLTLLVSNVLLACGESAAEEAVREETHALLAAVRRRCGTVILVSGETGQGVVPSTSVGRTFRDLLGWTNQDVAAQAEGVYLLVAGVAVEVKSLAASVEQAAAALADPSAGRSSSPVDPPRPLSP